jgi:predicted Zn finger-like uncharacterized protein
LYTQCAKCETVFRLSAEVLRAAGGQVRCGRCGEVFNALARLAEDASTFPAGESALELEARADEILQSTVPPVSQTAATRGDSEEQSPAGIEFARLQVLEKFDDDGAIDKPPPAPPTRSADAVKAADAAKAAAALKLAAATRAAAGIKAASKAAAVSEAAKPGGAAKTAESPKPGGPAQTADPSKTAAGVKPANAPKSGDVALPVDSVRRGAIAKSADVPSSQGARKQAPAAPEPELSGQEEDGSLEFTLPPGELDRIFVEAAPRSVPASAPVATAESPDPTRGEGSRSRIVGLEVSEDTRREMLEGIGDQILLPQIETPSNGPLPLALWLAAALVLALLLGGQIIHENREWFSTHAPLRGPLHGVYAAFGVAAPAAADLSSYQLRQWGVTGDPGASGTLRVRASILNTASQLQPYPLLRVTLANRFGARIGARDFEPAEYMGRPIVRMLAPGERADATLDIVDPGKDAEGFEIDVCLRSIGEKILCAGDVAAQAKQ